MLAEDAGGSFWEDCATLGVFEGKCGALPQALPGKHEYKGRKTARKNADGEQGGFMAKPFLES